MVWSHWFLDRPKFSAPIYLFDSRKKNTTALPAQSDGSFFDVGDVKGVAGFWPYGTFTFIHTHIHTHPGPFSAGQSVRVQRIIVYG